MADYKQIQRWRITLQDSRDNAEKVGAAIWWANRCFRVFVKHHCSGNSFFRENICSKYLLHLFPLWMELNGMEKSTNNRVASRFFIRTLSMLQRIVRISDVVDRFLRKLDFRLNTIEKQDTINLSSNSSKSYVFVVLCDFKVTVLVKREHAVFCTLLYWVLFMYRVCIIEEVYRQMFLPFRLQETFRRGIQFFWS